MRQHKYQVIIHHPDYIQDGVIQAPSFTSAIEQTRAGLKGGERVHSIRRVGWLTHEIIDFDHAPSADFFNEARSHQS